MAPGKPAADDARDGDRGHEDRGEAGPARHRDPGREIEENARKEADLRRSDQEAQNVVMRRRRHEGHGGREQAPEQHDAQQSEAGADAGEDDIARHLEQTVAEIENAAAEPVRQPR